MGPEPIDSILILSFGGPEGPDDVMPFLRNVTAGRNVPDDRLETVAQQYLRFEGKSPINDLVRDLIASLQAELDQHGPHLPIYWGNRNWAPFVEDAMRQMSDDGRRSAVAFVTSAYSSYSSCRQYRQNIAVAQQAVGEGAPEVHKIRQFYNHPGFIEPMVRNTQTALATLDDDVNTRIVFTAHSIPMSMAQTSRYVAQLQEAAQLVNERVGGGHDWDLVFQSRSGPPHIPWLEPDINDHLRNLRDKGVVNVVIVPIGFVADHMEVIYDLDTQAAETAAELGMNVARARTVGNAPEFVTAIRELIQEHIDAAPQRKALGLDGPAGCLGPTCCPAPSAH